jgi:hypothetical protein
VITVTDSFLPFPEASFVQEQLLSPAWPWFFQDSVDYAEESGEPTKSQFCYQLYRNHSWQGAGETIVSRFLRHIKPLTLVRVKANLQVRTETRQQNSFHIDLVDPDLKPYPHLLTAIYYVNTNNGVTMFEDGTEVQSVANRMVVFPSSVKHTGTTCTDAKCRVLINFNYLPERFTARPQSLE